MANYIYNGEEERTFPTLGITVKHGDKFEAPEDFKAPNVSIAKTTKATPAPTQESEE